MSNKKEVMPLKRSFIAKEGYPFILVLAIAAVGAYLYLPPLSALFLFLMGFVAFFFRDPERPVPTDPRAAVSPADGRVMYVKKVTEDRFLKGEATLVSIFLSITDVHINRSPIEGAVKYREYVPGKYIVAYAEKASEINERNYLGLEKDGLKVLVCQIAGLVARRIVCWAGEGSYLQKGERFGLIKFGSCTQVYLPPEVEVTVKPGDVVRGGISIIGRMQT